MDSRKSTTLSSPFISATEGEEQKGEVVNQQVVLDSPCLTEQLEFIRSVNSVKIFLSARPSP